MVLNDVMDLLGYRMTATAKNNLKTPAPTFNGVFAHMATGRLYNSIGWKVINKGTSYAELEVSYSDYGDYIQYGRPPGGKLPPVSVIAKWAKLKGLAPKGKKKSDKNAATQIAWAIAKSIQKKGTKPYPFLDNAITTITDEVESNGGTVGTYLNDYINGMFAPITDFKF